MTLSDRLKRLIPTREQLEGNRYTKWCAPWLGERKLWHWSRRGVALGVGVGMFFGLLTPLAQAPLALGAAVLLRANVPAAVASTLVTNPVTWGPIYYAAWRTGARLLGRHPLEEDKAALAELESMAAQELTSDTQAAKPLSTWHRIQRLGAPLLLGMAVFAVVGGAVSYLLIHFGWWGYTRIKRWRRQRGPGSAGPGERL